MSKYLRETFSDGTVKYTPLGKPNPTPSEEADKQEVKTFYAGFGTDITSLGKKAERYAHENNLHMDFMTLAVGAGRHGYLVVVYSRKEQPDVQ